MRSAEQSTLAWRCAAVWLAKRLAVHCKIVLETPLREKCALKNANRVPRIRILQELAQFMPQVSRREGAAPPFFYVFLLFCTCLVE